MLKIVVAILTLFSLIGLNQIYAQNTSIPTLKLKSSYEHQDTYPGMPYYSVKRLFEKISGKLLFMKDSRINFEQKLLKKRFSELKYIIETKNLDEIQRTSERFAYQAGILTNLNLKEPKEKKERIITLFKNYKDDLTLLKFNFEMDSSYWILMLHDVNSLDSLTARLEKN